MATIEERVKEIIVNQLGVDPMEVVSIANFVEDLGADELDLTQLLEEIGYVFFNPKPSISQFKDDFSKGVSITFEEAIKKYGAIPPQMFGQAAYFLTEKVKTVGELTNWVSENI